MNLALKSDINK